MLTMVEHSARLARDATVARDETVRRALRLGLSGREIAKAAQVVHNTIRAIGARAG